MGDSKEVKFMECKEFGDMRDKRSCTSGQFSGASSRGRASFSRSCSLQHQGIVHATMQVYEGGKASHGPYISGQSSHGSQ